jgi:hypothetical protein
MLNWSPEEKKSLPPKYGCEILIEDGSQQQVRETNFPNDAYIITYKVDDKTHQDLCRGTRVKIFDLYYDKFGAGAVQDIDWGYGRVSPRMWGYKVPEKKRRK